MTYRLKFLPVAQKEWKKLATPIQSQFKKKLAERLENPHVISAKLSGYDSVYKIKLRTAGYRLAYEVIDDEVVVYVLAIGKRDKNAIYKKLASRFE
jgi:mRNA interferase RelE/StbE